jgi:hypothetical protein
LSLLEVPILDGTLTSRTARFEQQVDGSVAARSVLEVDGNAVSTAGLVAIPVNDLAGSTGLDFSANIPTLPNVGAGFAASGPYASYVLIKTVAAGVRNNIDIENISGAQIAIIRDDGTASAGSAPANASVFALAGGGGVGQQGGSWSSQTFRGRLQIYAASSSAIVAVMVD